MFPAVVSDVIKSLRHTQSCPDKDLHAQPQEINQRRERSYSTELPSTAANTGVAAWDYKRHKCSNCKHIYLKSLSPAVGFCSMDCKSNAMYLHAMSEKIKAVKDCVQAEHVVQASVRQEAQPEAVDNQDDVCFESDLDHDTTMASYCPPSTFAEFHTRKLTCRPVEWSFSAMY